MARPGMTATPRPAAANAWTATADPGLVGQVSEGDVVAAARQPVAPREHGLEGVIEQVDAVVVA
jgi:hypothetical protein